MPNAAPRILIYDIETINLAADLSPVLVLGYKWLNDSRTHALSIFDDKRANKLPFAKRDRFLLETFLTVIDEADGLVAHYGDRFDRRFLNTRLVINGLPAIDRHIVQEDTWRLLKDNFKLCSNRLKNAGKAFGLKQQKEDSGGWNTWLNAVTAGPHASAAQKRLIHYCKQDVLATEALYLKIRELQGPTKTVNHNQFQPPDSKPVCPKCGKPRIRSKGWHRTATRAYRKFRCLACRYVFRLDSRDQNPR